MQTISATDLARNTREILDKFASRGESMVVERNHIMIAQNCAARASHDSISSTFWAQIFCA